jgi:ubiquinone/menaquinone biosynthesis C-methylase UbiE
MRIEIGARNYLLYKLLPHEMKMRMMPPDSAARLDDINERFNEQKHSGERATGYDRVHGYDAEHHEATAKRLITERWAPGGYGDALEVGAGSGYFSVLIARRATSVIAVEPVADLRAVIAERCRSEGVGNVRAVGVTAFDLRAAVPDRSVDTALVVQSLHHMHRRRTVFEELGRVVRPGGRLFLIEPHHNVRRVVRLAQRYLRAQRGPAFARDELRWATHDFLTVGELRRLCARGGFGEVRVTGHWLPYSRRLVRDIGRRVALEERLCRVPIVRHLAGVLAVEARRQARG